MTEEHVKFPKRITIENGGLKIVLESPFENIVAINKVDYLPYYLDNNKPRNRGGNSFVIRLAKAQDFDEDDWYPSTPDIVMKISKFSVGKFNEHKKSKRFKREIDALLDCNQHNFQNVVKIKGYGTVEIRTKGGVPSVHRYYLMEYAESDMLSYITNNELTLYDKVSLCIELCESLKQLWSKGYYHRDIKPENILFMDGVWRISDLGLAKHRDEDAKIDLGEKWIGPRGWMSPESMNRYLTESTRFQECFDCTIDHQSDIYQLGKVLWFILQGNAPEGGVRRRDFILQNDAIYQIVRTMINNSKKSRFKEIDEVILSFRGILNKITKSATEAA